MALCYSNDGKPIWQVIGFKLAERRIYSTWSDGREDDPVTWPLWQKGLPLAGKGLEGHSKMKSQHVQGMKVRDDAEDMGELGWGSTAGVQATGRDAVEVHLRWDRLYWWTWKDNEGLWRKLEYLCIVMWSQCRWSWYFYGIGYFVLSSTLPQEAAEQQSFWLFQSDRVFLIIQMVTLTCYSCWDMLDKTLPKLLLEREINKH